MKEFTHLGGITSEVRVKHLCIDFTDHPLVAQVILFKLHEQRHRLLLSIHGKSSVYLGKPITSVEVQNNRGGFVKDIPGKLDFQIRTDTAIAGIKENSNVFLSKFFAPVQSVFGIVSFTLFILFSIKTSEELIDLLRFCI